MIWSLMIEFLVCLLCTIVIEDGVALLLKYRGRDILIVLLVNVLTNPLLNTLTAYVLLWHGHRNYLYSLAAGELLVVVVEGFIYSKCLENKRINPWFLSVVLNACSYFLGIVIGKIIF